MRNLTTVPLAKDVDYKESIKAIDILEPGDLTVVDIEGNEVTYSFAALDTGNVAPYTIFPFRLELRIRSIVSATTTVPDASIVPLH